MYSFTDRWTDRDSKQYHANKNDGIWHCTGIFISCYGHNHSVFDTHHSTTSITWQQMTRLIICENSILLVLLPSAAPTRVETRKYWNTHNGRTTKRLKELLKDAKCSIICATTMSYKMLDSGYRYKAVWVDLVSVLSWLLWQYCLLLKITSVSWHLE